MNGSFNAFFSYRHLDPDRKLCKEIYNLFSNEGLRISADFSSFESSSSIISEIEHYMNNSACIVLFLSESYLESKYTASECDIAHCMKNGGDNLKVIPFYLEDCNPPNWIKSLVGIKWYESDGMENAIIKLYREIRNQVDDCASSPVISVDKTKKIPWGDLSAAFAGVSALAAISAVKKNREKIRLHDSQGVNREGEMNDNEYISDAGVTGSVEKIDDVGSATQVKGVGRKVFDLLDDWLL